VHGDIPDEIVRMHQAVVAAKAAAIGAIRAGATGQAVHAATTGVITAHGFAIATPGADRDDNSVAAMTHGTGHGIGLDVHEPPLLDPKGGELLVGDVVTVEPGLYKLGLGGVRVEDMVVVTADGSENLNTLPEGLDWK
jgi:Xaa-Pro aminopeptidase